MANSYYQKSFEKKHVKDIQILLKKKKKRQYHRESNKTLSEEEKQKQVQYK